MLSKTTWTYDWATDESSVDSRPVSGKRGLTRSFSKTSLIPPSQTKTNVTQDGLWTYPQLVDGVRGSHL